MERSINALLNSNLRVIIPDFGAFIIRQKEPRIVVFNEFLRYNDGLLIGYVAKTEGVDLEIADQLVGDFATNIIKVLDSGKSYNLEGIGLLQKDSSGKIIFESEDKNAKPDVIQEIETESAILMSEEEPPAIEESPAIEDLPVIEENPVKEETPIRVVVPEKEEPKSKPKSKPKPKPKPKPQTKQKAKVKTVGKTTISRKQAAEPVEIPHPAEDQAAPDEKLPEPIQQAEKPAAFAQPVVNEIKDDEKAPDQVNLIIKWIVIILLANAAIIAWFIFGDSIRGLFKTKKPQIGIMDSVYENLSDSVRAAALDTTLIFKESSELIAIEKDTSARENLRYYIVAGCFRDEINADELVKSLKDQGFSAEKFGKIGNLYAVSFASFNDKEMAVKELKRIREDIHPEAWMTRF